MTQHELSDALDLHLNRTCKHVELLGADHEMSLWLFDRDDRTSGMVVIESNDDLVGVPPTVSISITLSTNVGLSVQELLKLFSINGLLFDAAITAESVGGEWTFYVQKKVKMSEFKVEDFQPILDHLNQQKDIIVEG